MEPGAVPAEWREVFVLDAHTVQLGAGDQAVRIIGPAQQTLERLEMSSGDGGLTEAAGDPPTVDGQPDPDHGDLPGATASTRVRARRQLAAVLIDGLPRAAALLAEQLIPLPLGLLLLRDEHPVDGRDVAAGYSAAAVGQTRAAAVRRSCLRQDPEAAVIVSAAPQEPVDIHVVFAERAVDPVRLADAADRAQLVLPVVRHQLGPGSGQWQIGPLLSRDPGPCPQCLQLHGMAADPHWEAVQTALAEHQTPAPPPAVPEAPQSVTVLASLLAREIQLAVDGEVTPQTASRSIRLCTTTGQLSLDPVTPHPECSCRLTTPASG